ncbi:hypothetical protein N2152v2_009017 [Parachlorella kessleri]
MQNWALKDPEERAGSSLAFRAAEEHEKSEQQKQQQQRPSPGLEPKKGVSRERRREEPLLQEHQGGGVQGLGWVHQRMLKDEDGDVAHEFLEEPAPSQRGGDSGGSEHKRQRKGLQCCVMRLKPAGPSDVLVDKGNVYVVPHDD